MVLVETQTASEVMFLELYTSIASACANAKAIHQLAEESAPEGLIIGDVLQVQSGSIRFFSGTV